MLLLPEAMAADYYHLFRIRLRPRMMAWSHRARLALNKDTARRHDAATAPSGAILR